MRAGPSKSSRAARVAYAAALGSSAGLAAWHGAAWLGSATLAQLPALMAALLAGALVADFVAGAVHWSCDTWGDEDTPWIGPHLIRWFRHHHDDPVSIARLDSVDIDGPAALAAAPALALLALPPAQAWLEPRAPLHAFLWALCCVGAIANHLHAWAHCPDPPPAVRWLQRRGLVLSRRAHARHHRLPRTTSYCIATGWLNRPLDAVGFWRGLEAAVSRITGARPRGLEFERPAHAALRLEEGT